MALLLSSALFLLACVGSISSTSAMSNTTNVTILPDAYSNEVMSNVLFRLDSYMQLPIEAIRRINHLRWKSTFQYGMTAPDRKLLLSLLDNNLNGGDDFRSLIYVGLDDGTYFSVDNFYSVSYREPGNSGYKIKGIQEDDPYYKHYISCVNSTQGDPLNCTLNEVGALYVECVNDCELVECNSTLEYNDTMNYAMACRNQVIKTIQEKDVGLFGYVPTTTYCVDVFTNQIAQLPDFAYRPFQNEAFAQVGSCYYDDNMTVVDRNLSGAYAQCGWDGETCNTTFIGGYSSDNYDPRVRPWYIQTKYAQKPTWTKPAPAASGFYMSLSYNYPLSSYVNNTTYAFDGVVGQSYSLIGIQQFLLTQFLNSSLRVFVVEDDEPYYMIGTSWDQANTLSGVVTNISVTAKTSISKFVMVANESIPCTLLSDDANFTNVCKLVRKSVTELTDAVALRGFHEYQKDNFTFRNRGIYYQDDDIATKGVSPAYVAYTRLLSRDNIRWQVFVISSVPRSTSDALLKGDMMYAAVCVVATIGFITCFTMFYCFFQRRKEKAVIQADWRFTCAFILGCAFINTSSYALLGENTDQLCMLRMWLFNGLFVCALSPLFVKVWRMARLLNASSTFRRTVVTNFQAWLFTLPIVLLECILLAIVSIVDPPHQDIQLGVGDGIGYQVVQCTQNHRWFIYVQTIFHGTLVFVGCILAYTTRDLDPKYGEAKQLAFSMYNIAFTGIITILIVGFVQLDQVSKIVIQTISVLWGSCFCSLAFVLPRLLQVQKDIKLASSMASTKKNYMTTATSNTSFTNRWTTSGGFTSAQSQQSFHNVSGAMSNVSQSNLDVSQSHRDGDDVSVSSGNVDIAGVDFQEDVVQEAAPQRDDDQSLHARVNESYVKLMESMQESGHGSAVFSHESGSGLLAIPEISDNDDSKSLLNKEENFPFEMENEKAEPVQHATEKGVDDHDNELVNDKPDVINNEADGRLGNDKDLPFEEESIMSEGGIEKINDDQDNEPIKKYLKSLEKNQQTF